MELAQLLIILVLRINKVFVLGYSKREKEASKLFRSILLLFDLCYNRQSEKIGRSIDLFSVFIEYPTDKKLTTLEKVREFEDLGSFYAARCALNFFEEKWVRLCNSLFDLKNSKCLKSEEECFQRLYSFFEKCSIHYYDCYQKAFHLRECKMTKNHSELDLWNFEMLIENIYNRCNPTKDLNDNYEERLRKPKPFLKINQGCPLFLRK